MNLSDELALSYYKTVAEIAAGHSVWLVQHTQTKKFYVRKQLRVYHLDVYRSLQAKPVPGIPRIELLVEEEDGLTIIEEYMQGDTLQELIERDGSLPEERALEYVLQLCRIVAGLHHRDPVIIHRDIKPSNVIISPDGIVKLLDLNAAKYEKPEQSRDTMLLGTAGFAAPEQYGFAPSGVQSDLYAIGVLLNVLLTGKLPTGKAAVGRLSPIIRKCTELDPANRYASIDELIQALERIRIGTTGTADRHARTWRYYLPPGFRSGSVAHMFLAFFGYIFIILISLCIEVENATPLTLAMNRVTVLLIALAIVFFSADYLGVQASLPLTRSRHRTVRLVGIVLYDILIMVALVMALAVFESLVG
ncbi:MAG: serine/threonine protein kinase [Lachnospiraceae bacterium]|nr:serine/threonine protein kinase [Lachnospiraceae bacterium]